MTHTIVSNLETWVTDIRYIETLIGDDIVTIDMCASSPQFHYTVYWPIVRYWEGRNRVDVEIKFSDEERRVIEHRKSENNIITIVLE